MNTQQPMRVLITGSGGFIGKNLVLRLIEMSGIEVLSFTRSDSSEKLVGLVAQADRIIHLAGENRPTDVSDFFRVNTDLTRVLCDAIRSSSRKIPLIFASSTQVEFDNLYGNSKRAAEQVVEEFVSETGNPAVIYRLPGVFGKWCKPNYNSVVATFCYNIARDLPIKVNDAETILNLIYVDDLVDEYLHALHNFRNGLSWGSVSQTYSITLGSLAAQILAFKNCRTTLISERVGTGLTRALYSTFVSYLPPAKSVYDLTQHRDARGVFVEMLKTPDCGQFSFFTIYPRVTRGSHYHHTKTEKFLVVKGIACMRFRHMVTGETYEVTVSGDKPQVVDTIPGWVHDITNVGESEAVVMLWANEVFDCQRPDSTPCEV
jgi:UDP-2-acetamido-2,6-beta-L-arabino-hexul-4-ose reductase